MPERELLEEGRCCSVKKRTAQSLASTDDVDQTTLVERLENRARADAADLLYLGSPDGLPVRDDCQCFEGGGRETLGTRGKLSALDRFRILRPREDLPTASDFDQLDAVAVGVVVVP